MDPEKVNNHDNFHNFIKQQKEALGTFTMEKSARTSVLKPEELFPFLNEHFTKFHEKDNFRVVLAYVHRCLKVWIPRGDYLKDDSGLLLINLLVEHNDNENDTNIAIQIIYQFLYSIKFYGYNNVVISEKLLRELAEILLSAETRVLASNTIACMEKYMEIFPNSCKTLGTLWPNLKEKIYANLQNGLAKEIEIDILIQLFDYFKLFQHNFHDDPILIIIIQHLLISDQRKFRKCGYFLFKKLCFCFIESVSSVAKMWLPKDHNQHIERSWTIYITILENLEEEQSHLILPSLENLNQLIKSHHMQSSWHNVLYMRLLTHKNNLVLRWCLQFFMSTFSCADLCTDTLKHLLQASNCNSLFNYEGYFLKDKYFTSFLQGDVTILLPVFSQIENWKSLPLYKWLENLNENHNLETSLTFNEILKFCACVRKSQDKILRNKSIELCNDIFKNAIERMSANEYVMYVETLYNNNDNYNNHLILYGKQSSVIQSEDNSIFTQKFYEIFTKHYCWIPELFSFLKAIPVEKHGYLKYAPFQYELSEEREQDMNELYKLDLHNFPFDDLQEAINHFKIKFLDQPPPYDKDELIECEKAAIAFFIYKHPSFKYAHDDTLNLILNSGIRKREVISSFVSKFLTNQEKIKLSFIDKLLEFKEPSITSSVFFFLNGLYGEDTIRKYAKTIIEQIALNQIPYVSSIDACEYNLLKEVSDALLSILPSQGDKRIEEAFFVKSNKITPISVLYRCIRTQMKVNDSKYALDLLKLHLSITRKRPRYFENTLEHRVKLRIAVCIYYCLKYSNNAEVEILNEIWNILLDENNQLNVTYIYEFILGLFESRETVLIQKLNEAKNMTSRQQVSIITVAYTYFTIHNPTAATSTNVIYILLSLSMGANFQTRLFAQLSLYKLLKGKFGTMGFEPILKTIEDAAGDKLEEYLTDIRLNFIDISDHIIDAILYITNAPFDELNDHDFISHIDCELNEKVEGYRERYASKIKLRKYEETTAPNEANDQIQRKMNPTNDLTAPHNLIVYPPEENSAKMYVVASLINKLPNLGGIARTCEVLGIKNLVLDSKMHIEKNDFKSLSMTAEKNLNIHEVMPKDLKEFLLLKKLEGFSIVGAEQTCKSERFNKFQFPEKCVLLLGHEKDGIPAPLLSVLDNAVEIPQFGQVRSLNVHVTGALFMWEYCKQHLVQKLT